MRASNGARIGKAGDIEEVHATCQDLLPKPARSICTSRSSVNRTDAFLHSRIQRIQQSLPAVKDNARRHCTVPCSTRALAPDGRKGYERREGFDVDRRGVGDHALRPRDCLLAVSMSALSCLRQLTANSRIARHPLTMVAKL
jgi:hypothetical protein